MRTDHRQDAKAPRKEPEGWLDDLAREMVDAVYQVHAHLGPGLLEAVYEACLIEELTNRNIAVDRQVQVPIHYRGKPLDAHLRIDLLVDKAIVLELKAVEAILPVHEAQLMTYLKLSRCELGFLVNFNVPRIKDGIRRRVLHP